MNAITKPDLLNSDLSSESRYNCKVLLIEDDPQVNDLISRALLKKGYDVHVCHDGEKGLITALNQSWQLILLDIMLPGLDGLTLLRRLRHQKNNTPVIVLSACGAEQDRINGFHTGADDYLPKPFSMEELQLRMEALLRRCYQPQLQEDPSRQTDGYIDLNRLDKSARIRSEIIDVTPVEFELLWLLMRHADETLSRPYLYQAVLNRSYSRYDRSLDMHVSNLRQKLKQILPGEDLIRTIRGKGYRYR
ncbi:response regulator transcription factor [Oceanospirillum sediminis]|uniref:response regulator transcription factor n=1 Tax=Oceanospirillum sediminis TaxID=2760088 RepID=UPI001C7233EF|nr:response regulator transcription factor [Oceanospirillum sediminis]